MKTLSIKNPGWTGVAGGVLAAAYSLTPGSPSYQAGVASVGAYTHSTQDIAKFIRVGSNQPSPGAYGWTL